MWTAKRWLGGYPTFGSWAKSRLQWQAPKAGHRTAYTKRRAITRYNRGYMRRVGFYGRYNKTRIRQEIKFLDRTIPSSANIPIAGEIVDIKPILIIAGANETNRIGRKIRITSFAWRIHIIKNSATSTAGDHDMFRIIVGIDRQCNGAQPAVSDILETASNVSSFYNLVNTGRFKILHDKTHQLNFRSAGGAGGAADTRWGERGFYYKGYHRLNLPVEYDGTTGAITEIRTNNLFILLISHGATCAVGGEGLTRVRFVG